MQERDPGKPGSEESWYEREDQKRGDMLPEAALMPDGIPDTSTPSEEDMLPRDKQRKTAYYDYAAEKQLSQADSKLFYQRSQLETQKASGSNWGNSPQSPEGSPVISGVLPRAYSTVFEADQAGKRRSGSVNSGQSRHISGQKLVSLRFMSRKYGR
jgi:AMP deaminase